MKVLTLSNNESGPHGFTHKITLTHADLTLATADGDQTIELLAVGAGTFVDRAAYVLRTAFKDASDSAFNSTVLSVGDGTDPDRYLHSNTAGTGLQINENGTEVLYHINPVAASTAGLATAPYMYTGDDTVDALVESMSAKALVNIDVGEIDIFLRVVNLVAL